MCSQLRARPRDSGVVRVPHHRQRRRATSACTALLRGRRPTATRPARARALPCWAATAPRALLMRAALAVRLDSRARRWARPCSGARVQQLERCLLRVFGRTRVCASLCCRVAIVGAGMTWTRTAACLTSCSIKCAARRLGTGVQRYRPPRLQRSAPRDSTAVPCRTVPRPVPGRVCTVPARIVPRGRRILLVRWRACCYSDDLAINVLFLCFRLRVACMWVVHVCRCGCTACWC
jgi:hypothetical protein